jgi:hypothetical protein
MQIVTKMKVIMSPPGRILKEQPRTPRAQVRCAQLKLEGEQKQQVERQWHSVE